MPTVLLGHSALVLKGCSMTGKALILGEPHSSEFSRGSKRRAQIVDAVISLVDEHGVEGATTARIAAAVGVTEPTLYKYFSNRREMLIAALDVVFDAAEALLKPCACEATNAVKCLKNIGRYHSEATLARALGFVNPLFEFVVAPAETGLRDQVRIRSLGIIDGLAGIVEKGKTQGVIRPDVDARRVAWRIMGFYWFEDVSTLMDLPEIVREGISQETFEAIVAHIATPEAENS